MHYRFGQMRANAARHGKTVPSRADLAAIVEKTKMNCCGCGLKMNWLSRDGSKTVVSLQHNRDGSISFLCRSCNTRHASFVNDDFYHTPKTHHPCGDCRKLLFRSEFYADKSRPLGIKSYCKKCAYERYKKWAVKNSEYINKKQRERRLLR
jgi:hypothetical protein